MKRFGLFAVLLAGQLAAIPAFAGIADTPLPELEAGKKTYHLYSVPFAPRENGMEPVIENIAGHPRLAA